MMRLDFSKAVRPKPDSLYLIQVASHLLLLFLAAMTSVWILKLIYGDLKIESSLFHRRELAKISPAWTIIIPQGYNRLAGVTDQFVYFQGDNPYTLRRLDTKRLCYSQVELPTLNGSRFASKQFFTKIDSPFSAIFFPNLPGLGVFNFTTGKSNFYNIPGLAFSKGIIIDSMHYLIRQLDLKAKDQRFVIGNAQNDSLKEISTELPLLHDGGLLTDGIFDFDSETGLAAFVCLYQSLFMVIDTRTFQTRVFKMLYRIGNGQIAKNVGNDLYTNVSPLTTLHSGASISGNFIFVISRVEAMEKRNSTSEKIVDVYNSHNGTYKGSLYLQSLSSEGALKLVVRKGVLYIIQNRKVSLFLLPD